MGEVLQTKGRLDLRDLGLGSKREDLVDVRDDGLHVRRAVLRHVLPNGLEILPEVTANSIISDARETETARPTRSPERHPMMRSPP